MVQRQAPPTWDDGAYLETSFVLWNTLARGDVLGFLDGFSRALGFKAPLIALQPFPIFLVGGKGFFQASVSNLLPLAALSYCAWRLGERLKAPYGGVLAVWFVNLTPLVYGLSRHFYVETLLAALCAGIVYCLVEGGRARLLGALIGLSLLCKVTTPVYVGVPVVLLALRRRGWRDWAWAAGIAGALAATWYVRNLHDTLLFAKSAGYGATAGVKDPWTWARGWSYVRTVALEGVGWPQLALGTLAGCALLWRGKRPADWRESLALTAWAVVPCFFFATGLAPEVRWSGPAAAAAGIGIAVLVAYGLESVKNNARPWMAAAALLLPAAVYAEQTFGVGVFPAVFGPPRAYVWNGPPEKGGLWGQDKLWDFVAKDAASTPGVKRVLLALSHRFFNSSTAGAYAQMNGWPVQFRNYNRYPTAMGALRFIAAYQPDYIVSLENLPEPVDAGLNKHNAVVLEAIKKGVLPYKQWAEADMPNRSLARVFKRTRVAGR